MSSLVDSSVMKWFHGENPFATLCWVAFLFCSLPGVTILIFMELTQNPNNWCMGRWKVVRGSLYFGDSAYFQAYMYTHIVKYQIYTCMCRCKYICKYLIYIYIYIHRPNWFVQNLKYHKTIKAKKYSTRLNKSTSLPERPKKNRPRLRKL